MSFSGTPLGQGRRLDHQTFLNGGPPHHLQPQNTTSPPRKVPSTSSIPLSYAYGAPTLGNPSPGKSSSSTSPRAQRNPSPPRPTVSFQPPGPTESQTNEEEDEERALARYARLKQRNQALANRPGSSLGPGIITSPPKPNGASLKDTSVNIASAFHQAASSFAAMSNTNSGNTWRTSTRQNLPRSTSVEYEEGAQSTSHRRLAVPPNRNGPRSNLKPISRNRSIQHISDAENEHSGEVIDANGRAKSPFDHLSDFTKRAMSPASFLMRQRSQEPEEILPPSRQATDATLVGQNNSASYDYAEEEEEYQKSLKPSSGRAAASTAHKRNRMSTDNKAYRPTASDIDSESDDEPDEDGRKGRKRKTKLRGGPLTTLPVAGYDKRKKKKSRSSKGNAHDEDGGISDENASDQQRAAGSVTPTQHRGSVPLTSRASVTPLEPPNYDQSGPTDSSMDIEQGLEPISETEEIDMQPPPDIDTSREDGHYAGSSTLRRRRSAFSIGAFLGNLVNLIYRFGHGIVVFIFRLLAMITLLVGRILGSIVDITIRRPVRFFSTASGTPFTHLGKYVVVALGMYMAWYALRHPSLMGLSSGFSSRPGYDYQAPHIPPGNVDELTSRLLKLENALSDLQSETLNSHSRLESDLRKQRDVAGRVNKVEARLEKEVARAQKSEEDFRLAASQGIEGLQKEVQSLHGQLDSVARAPEAAASDEEARAKLRAFEDRLGGVEGGVKEALELGKATAKAGGAAMAASGSAWWNKLASGVGSGSGLTIKSSDGQDVTSLISHLVESAVSMHTKDDLARTDFAFHSGGAQVIPSLTSPTYEVKPTTKRGYLYSFISGNGYSIGRPPVTALHHDLHLGHCWPFAGAQGQLAVALAAPVYISDITIDHVAKEVAHDMRSAPREMEVWGMIEGEDNLVKFRDYEARREQAKLEAEENGMPIPADPSYPSTLSKNPRYMRIASFKYDVHSPNNIQTFPVSQEIQELGIDFGLVVLTIKSNWGSEFTCLYRMRVHGTRLNEVPPIPDIDESV